MNLETVWISFCLRSEIFEFVERYVHVLCVILSYDIRILGTVSYDILHFTFLFSLFVFVSAAGHYFRIWTGHYFSIWTGQIPALLF